MNEISKNDLTVPEGNRIHAVFSVTLAGLAKCVLNSGLLVQTQAIGKRYSTLFSHGLI